MCILAASSVLMFAIASQSSQPAASTSATSEAASTPPNVLLVVMDDMRSDELWAMPFVAGTLAQTGAVFENATVSNPLCCPSRASLLTGYYAKNHGTLHNEKPDGSAFAFAARDGDTIATRAKGAGRRTGLIGKYLNHYPTWAAQHPGQEIPPGWDVFMGCANPVDWSEWSWWVGGSGTGRGPGTLTAVQRYATDEIFERASEFCAGSEPWVLYVCPLAPHSPAAPAAADIARLEPFAARGGWVKRGPSSWGEDVSDKPAWVRTAAAGWWAGDYAAYTPAAPFRPGHVTPDDLAADRLRCLLAVDRGLALLWDELWAGGTAGRTWIFFVSDNGFLLGEHRLFDKGAPYEESVRVPLIAWHAAIEPAYIRALVEADVDLPATIAELCGFPLPGAGPADGRSFLPALQGGGGRAAQYAQSWPADNQAQDMAHEGVNGPGWAMLRDSEGKYVELDTGEREYYDLAGDPFETLNAVHDAAYAERVAALAEDLAARRGLSVRTHTLPAGTRGAAYACDLEAWGGAAPYVWAIQSGTLPAGVTLSPEGRLSGTPAATGTFEFDVRVRDGSASPLHGGPQRVTRALSLTISP